MDYLIIVRHGEYDKRSSHLTREGRTAVGRLTRSLQQVFRGKSFLLFSSSAIRARETATILGRRLGVCCKAYRFLRSTKALTRRQLLGAVNLIRRCRQKTDVIILVTHLEFVRDLPVYVGQKELNVNFPRRVVDKGGACVINFHKKEANFIDTP